MTLLECQEMSSSKPDKEIHLQVSEVDLAASPGSRAFKTSLDKVEEVQGNKASETYSKNLRNSLVVHNKEVEAREDKALEEDSKVEISCYKLRLILWMPLMVARRVYRLVGLTFAQPAKVQEPNQEPVKLNVVLVVAQAFRQ